MFHSNYTSISSHNIGTISDIIFCWKQLWICRNDNWARNVISNLLWWCYLIYLLYVFHTICCQNIPMAPNVIFMRGGGGSQNQTGPILVHIYPLLDINVKHGSNLIRTFWVKTQIMNTNFHCFRGHGGLLHKIQRYLGY